MDSQLWKNFFSLFGTLQAEQAMAIGTDQSRISEKIKKGSVSRIEGFVLSVAAAAMLGESDERRRQILDRAKMLRDLMKNESGNE